MDTKKASTSRLVSKTKYDSGKESLKRKIEDVDMKISNTRLKRQHTS